MPAAARHARLLPQPCTPSSTTPLGASSAGALPSKAVLRLMQPLAQLRQAADLGELRGIRFVGERAAAVQELVLRGEHQRHVLHGERAVVEDRLAREAFGVRRIQAREVVDELLERVRRRSPAGWPFVCCHCCATRVTIICRSLRVGMPSCSARREVLQLLRTGHFVADEHDRARHLLVALRDVLEHADVDRIREIRVEIAAARRRRRRALPSDAGAGRRARSACAGPWHHVDIRAAQAFGHGPLEHAPFAAAAGALRRFADQGSARGLPRATRSTISAKCDASSISSSLRAVHPAESRLGSHFATTVAECPRRPCQAVTFS